MKDTHKEMTIVNRRLSWDELGSNADSLIWDTWEGLRLKLTRIIVECDRLFETFVTVGEDEQRVEFFPMLFLFRH